MPSSTTIKVPQRDSATASTLVALFAALAGFFIALSQISSPTRGSAPDAFVSVVETFGGALRSDRAVLAPLAEVTERDARQAIIAELAGGPQASGADETAEAAEFRAPLVAFFAPGEARLRGDRAPALAAAADIAIAEPDLVLEVVLLEPPRLAREKARTRLLVLGARLLAVGVPPEQLEIGTAPAPELTTPRFSFRARIATARDRR